MVLEYIKKLRLSEKIIILFYLFLYVGECIYILTMPK